MKSAGRLTFRLFVVAALCGGGLLLLAWGRRPQQVELVFEGRPQGWYVVAFDSVGTPAPGKKLQKVRLDFTQARFIRMNVHDLADVQARRLLVAHNGSASEDAMYLASALSLDQTFEGYDEGRPLSFQALCFVPDPSGERDYWRELRVLLDAHDPSLSRLVQHLTQWKPTTR